jgi:hypothetical protein
MMKLIHTAMLIAAVLGLGTLAQSTHAAPILKAIDTQSVDSGGVVSGDSAQPDIGFAGTVSSGVITSGTVRSAIIVFDLQSLTDAVSTATLGAKIDSRLNGATSQYNGDLYAVRSSNSASILSSDHYVGPFASGLHDDFINGPGAGTDNLAEDLVTHSSAALVSFLNNARTAGNRYVFFRISPDSSAVPGQSNRRWEIYGTGAASDQFDPYLDLTLVPEPSALALLSLAAVPMLRRRRV